MTRIMLTVGLSICLAAPMAHAKAKKSKKSKAGKYAKLKLGDLDPSLTGLKFGGDEAAAMKWVTTRFQHHYDPTIAKSQGVEKQRWIDKVAVDAKGAQNAAIDYKGGKSGFETSIIGKDFGRVKGERLIVAKVGKTKHYLMFFEGALWRYAVSVRPTGTFQQKVAGIAVKVGPPLVQRTTPRSFAGWIFQKLRVELRDQRVMYNGDTLIVTHRAIGSKVAKAFAKAGGAAAKKSGTEGLDDVLVKPDTTDADTKAADKELEEYERKHGKRKKKKKK